MKRGVITRTMFLNWMNANSRLWNPGANLLRTSHFDIKAAEAK